MTGGLISFFFQFLVQSGIFFTIPLFLSVVLELNALQTGLRLLPLSIALLAAAVAIPKLAPRASPRLVVRLGMLAMLAGTLVLVGGLDPGANAAVVLIPMALVGLGIGALASQLGAVTVSAVPDDQSAEVGGSAEHVHQLRRILGHRAGRSGADRQPDRRLPRGSDPQPRRPGVGHRQGHRAAGERGAVHLRQ